MPFNEPEVSGRLNPRDVVGHLLMVWPVEYIAHSPTKFSKAGQPSDVIVVDVVDLDDVDEGTGLPGKLARNVWWRPGRLIASLKKQVGTKDPYLAWMSQGGASQGMNAPFILVSATSDRAAVAKAEAWLAAYPEFRASEPVGQGEQFGLGRTIEPEPVPQPEPAASPAPRVETVLERLARLSQEGAARLQTSPPQDIPF